MVQTYYLQWGWECLLILFFVFFSCSGVGTRLVDQSIVSVHCPPHRKQSNVVRFPPIHIVPFLCVHFCSGLLSSCDVEDAGVSAACSERCTCITGCQCAFRSPDTALYCANCRKVLRWLQESPAPRKPRPTRRGQIQFFTTIRTKQIFRLFGLRCSS